MPQHMCQERGDQGIAAIGMEVKHFSNRSTCQDIPNAPRHPHNKVQIHQPTHVKAVTTLGDMKQVMGYEGHHFHAIPAHAHHNSRTTI
jgi:hypothetical protein